MQDQTDLTAYIFSEAYEIITSNVLRDQDRCREEGLECEADLVVHRVALSIC